MWGIVKTRRSIVVKNVDVSVTKPTVKIGRRSDKNERKMRLIVVLINANGVVLLSTYNKNAASHNTILIT